jgi:hypothetical protein
MKAIYPENRAKLIDGLNLLWKCSVSYVKLGGILTTVIERITHFYFRLHNRLFVIIRPSSISRLKVYFILHRLMEGKENFMCVG